MRVSLELGGGALERRVRLTVGGSGLGGLGMASRARGLELATGQARHERLGHL
jgi:hypothetical protein